MEFKEIREIKTWTEYLTARLATESPRRMRWEMANLFKLLSLQKLPEVGLPTISFNFHGALNAAVWISLSEATELQILQTQPARAKSSIGSFSKMILRTSLQIRAEKLEFIGEIVASLVIMEVVCKVCEWEGVIRGWWRRLSSSSSPQHLNCIFWCKEILKERFYFLHRFISGVWKAT